MGEFFIISAFVGGLLFFFPLYVDVNAYLDVSENKCAFSVNLYRFFKVLGGYGQLTRAGVAVHIGLKKAILIPYAKMADTRKKFEVAKGFQLLSYRQIVEMGGADSVTGVMLGAVSVATANAVFSAVHTKFPFTRLNSDTLLTKGAKLKITLQNEVVFNGLVLTIAITKKMLEALINWIRIKKSTVSSKRRQNA